MVTNHRIFTSFAIEDANLRTLLVGQSRHEQIPFSFVDMSVKEPWDNSWKTICRTKINGCDGMIGIITKNTPKADGQLWELNCAYQESIPVLLIYGTDDRLVHTPDILKGRRILTWSWQNIKIFLNNL
jgi:hypothetical protein